MHRSKVNITGSGLVTWRSRHLAGRKLPNPFIDEERMDLPLADAASRPGLM